jgi:hypothetical protein
MDLKQRLLKNKDSLVTTWRDAAVIVPAGAGPDFLEKQRTLVLEPMEYDLEQGMGGLFDALLQGVLSDDVSRFLDSMIRIRAASDFTASESVAFILEVKKAVRIELGNETLSDLELQEGLAAWDSAVDDLALFAFNIYVQCRETVLEARAIEESQKTLRLLKQAKLIPEDQE